MEIHPLSDQLISSTSGVATVPHHQKMMLRCLQIAKLGAGFTSPGPLVGCVIERDGEVVGEGYHLTADEPHAVMFALRAAGGKAKGATAYVSLEPSNHFGRPLPCSESLVKAEVTKVVVGMVDPDPRLSGKGIGRLRKAGIQVVVGVEEAECQRVNEAFVHRVLYQRPFGILKYAMTLDGKIATTAGHSAWITKKVARTYVHQLRATCDVVIVGGNTVRRDNPHLTTHHQGNSNRSPNNPLRVVLSRTLDLPPTAHLWETEVAPTIVLTQGDPNPNSQAYLEKQGVEVVNLDALTPQAAMAYLGQRELMSVLWECGGTLSAHAIEDGSVQKVLAFIAPKIVGGKNAPSPVGDLGFHKMTEALQLERVRWNVVGEDCLLEGYLPKFA